MPSLWQDVRFAARALLKTPGFTAAVLLMLSLGVGANAAIFSVLRAVLLRPLPFAEPERLVVLGESNPGWGATLVSSHAFFEWRSRTNAFENMSTTLFWEEDLEHGDTPRVILSSTVSPEYFEVMGVAPLLGRTFRPEEGSSRANVVVLSHKLWRELGADRGIVGEALRLDGIPHTVLGAMPPVEWSGPFVGWADAWFPSFLDEARVRAQPSGWRGFGVIARRKAGVTLEEARADLGRVQRQLQQELPRIYEGYTATVEPLEEFIVGGVRPALRLLAGAVVVVLLIACANVSGLVLARSLSRDREIAIRIAQGASRSRIVRQLLVESLVLSTGAAVLGALTAHGVMLLVKGMNAAQVPRLAEARLDLPVLAGALGLSWLAALVFGLAPALRASRPLLSESLREGGRSSSSRGAREARRLLVVAEVALCTTLLAGAGLLLKSLLELWRVDAGFQRENVLTAHLSLPEGRYGEEGQRKAFFRALVQRLESIPGVMAAGGNRYFPLRDRQYSNPIFVEGFPVPEGQEPVVQYGGVTTGYFEAMGIPIVEGRGFTEGEIWETGGVVLVNRSMARRLWPGRSPLGLRIKHGAEAPWLTIVGIASDVRQRTLDQEPYPQIYVPYADFEHADMTLALRIRSAPEELVEALRKEVEALDPGLPLSDVMTLEEAMSRSLSARRLVAFLLSAFSGLSLVLAVGGVYASLAYSISRRVRELGLRLALGARPGDLVFLVTREGMRTVGIGLVLGSAGALVLGWLVRGQLFGVSPLDLSVLSTSVVLLAALALAGCLVPAGRAARVDPLVALRQE
jgi:putative ABC transport system permease protein